MENIINRGVAFEPVVKPARHPLHKEGKQMRKLFRSIARANMEKRGVKRINAQRYTSDKKRTSFFAQNWRRWAITD